MCFLLWFLLFQTSLPIATETTAVPVVVPVQASAPTATAETEAPCSEALTPVATGEVTEATISSRVGETIQQVLAGEVVGLTIVSTSESSGGITSFAMRMPPSLGTGEQPLYVLDGVPLSDSSDSARLADLIPADMVAIDVLKGPAATALYGTRGTFGVILMKTRRGAEGKPTFSFRQSLGTTTVAKKLGSRHFSRQTATDAYGSGVDTYWQPEYIDHEAAVFQDDASALETLFSARGSIGHTRYYLSGTSLGQSGIVAGSENDRKSLRLNLDHSFSDRFALGLNLGFTHRDQPLAASRELIDVLANTPSFLSQAPDAAGNYPGNPFSSENLYGRRDFLADSETKVRRNTASVNMTFDLLRTDKDTLDVALIAGLDDAVADTEQNFTSARVNQREDHRDESARLVLTHRRELGHVQLRSRLGYQYDESERASTKSIYDEGYQSITRSRASSLERGFYIEETLTGSWYAASAGVRSDREPRHTYQAPWVNGALLLSQRGFWRAASPWVQQFKLRAAWGRSFVERPISFFVQPTTDLPDRHREWEAGLDAGFWSGRGALALTYFNRKVEDWDLYSYRPSEPSETQMFDNARRMSVDGWEASLSLTPLKGDDWRWQTRMDYYQYSAKVIDMLFPGLSYGGLSFSLGAYSLQPGLSPTSIIGSNIDAAGNRIVLGDVTPDYQLTWHNDLQYGAWSLNWLLDMREGGDAIELNRLITDLAQTSPDLDQHPNRLTDWYNGDTRPWIQDSSYVRLREVRLAYKPQPGRFHLGDWLSSLEFALSGRNLKSWSDFTGYDPEQGSISLGSTSILSYPTTKAVYLSISLGFPAGR